MSSRVALLDDPGASEVELGGERIVGLAPQRQIRFRVRAAVRERLQVVELEVMSLLATTTGVVSFRPIEDEDRSRGCPPAA
jgi:hypothetical protein